MYCYRVRYSVDLTLLGTCASRSLGQARPGPSGEITRSSSTFTTDPIQVRAYRRYRGLQVGCQQAQTLKSAYQNISIHLNKQFYSSNWPITTMPGVFCICNLTTNLQSFVYSQSPSVSGKVIVGCRASSRKFPKGVGGKNRFSKILGGGGMHLATLMHRRLCHLLYNDVICIVGVSRGWDLSRGVGGQDFVKGGGRPLSPPPLNEFKWSPVVVLSLCAVAQHCTLWATICHSGLSVSWRSSILISYWWKTEFLRWFSGT